MTIRTLPAPEYPRLASIEEGTVPNPDHSIVVVAEDDDGNIVGRMMLVVVPHLERTWLAPEARGGTVAYRLERAICAEAEAAGLRTVFAYTTTPEHTSYMERLGWANTHYDVLRKDFKET